MTAWQWRGMGVAYSRGTMACGNGIARLDGSNATRKNGMLLSEWFENPEGSFVESSVALRNRLNGFPQSSSHEVF